MLYYTMFIYICQARLKYAKRRFCLPFKSLLQIRNARGRIGRKYASAYFSSCSSSSSSDFDCFENIRLNISLKNVGIKNNAVFIAITRGMNMHHIIVAITKTQKQKSFAKPSRFPYVIVVTSPVFLSLQSTKTPLREVSTRLSSIRFLPFKVEAGSVMPNIRDNKIERF